MFLMLGDALGWVPVELRKPLIGFLSVLALMVLIRFTTILLSIFSTILQIIIPWK